MSDQDRVEILSDRELGRTLVRLATQVLEQVEDSRSLMLLGIPTRGVELSRVLARELERLSGHPIAQGSIDPTFHRDDLRSDEPCAIVERFEPLIKLQFE